MAENVKKRAVVGLKGIALAKVTKNNLEGYKSEAAMPIQWAGKLAMSAKESSQSIYYDDVLYKELKDLKGFDVTLNMGEITLEALVALGLGAMSVGSNTLEADFAPKSQLYALRYVTDTVDQAPYYWNYRVFDLTGIRYGDYATKGDSVTVNEVIITGTIMAPVKSDIKPYVIMRLADDGSNLAACEAFLKDGEELAVTAG